MKFLSILAIGFFFISTTVNLIAKDSVQIISNPEIVINNDSVILKPGRKVKSAVYKNYNYSLLEFQAVYGKFPEEITKYSCDVVSEKTRIEKSNKKKESSPIAGFKFIDYECRIPKKEILSYHISVFESSPEYNKNKLSFLLTKIGWVAFQKDKGILHEVFNFDNGPDPFSEGYYRMIQDDKMGFANEKGEVVIKPIYDWVETFQDSEAKVCIGCKKTYMGEHYKMEGGKWNTISRPKSN